jgi:hypothetical protein
VAGNYPPQVMVRYTWPVHMLSGILNCPSGLVAGLAAVLER